MAQDRQNADTDEESAASTAAANGAADLPLVGESVTWELARQHVPLLISAVTIVLIIVRLFQVTRGDLVSATALVSAAGPFNVGLNALLSAFPVIVQVAFTWGMFKLGDWARGASRFRWWHVALFWLLPFVFDAISWIAVVLILIFVASTTGFVWWLDRRSAKSEQQPFPFQASSAALAPLFLLLIGDQMWLPPEVVSTESQVVVAYVIELGPEWTTLMRDDDRSVFRLETDTIQHRALCETDDLDAEETTLDEVLNPEEEPRYPTCDALVESIHEDAETSP